MTESVDETTPARTIDPAFWVSEQAVYGVILVGGLILVAGEHGDASWDTFWTVIVTVFVFWLAHVFAGVVAHPEFLQGKNGALKTAIRTSEVEVCGTCGIIFDTAYPVGATTSH